MPQSQEIQEQMRNKTVDMYQSGKSYKAMSKSMGLQRTMVRAIIHKWRKLGTVVNLPRSDWPTKMTPRARWRLIQKVIKEPRTTSIKLALLASIKVSIHDSTIRKRLGKNGIHGKGKATADQKKHSKFSAPLLEMPQRVYSHSFQRATPPLAPSRFLPPRDLSSQVKSSPLFI